MKYKLSLLSRKRSLGFRPTVDIEVSAKDHLFVLNGSVITHNCSFCKESLVARSYSETNIYETSGVLKLTFEGKEKEFPAKTKVKFYDPNVDSIVYGPLQTPVGLGFPIAKESLEKLFKGDLSRLLAD